jgi:hypothetical protein
MNSDTLAGMPRPIQVYLSDLDCDRLDAWAKEHGWTKSQAVREAIRLATKASVQDPILDLVGIFDGWPRDASSRVDHYLNQADLAERKTKSPSRPARSRAAVRR